MASAESEQVARTGLACIAVIRLVGVCEACKLEAVMPPPLTTCAVGWCLYVADHILEGLEVNLRGIFLSTAKDAQCYGNVWARTNGRVDEAAQEAGIYVLRHACDERRVHARKAGHEAGIHREWRGFAVRHAVIVKDVT
jgi:hypothetical protein